MKLNYLLISALALISLGNFVFEGRVKEGEANDMV